MLNILYALLVVAGIGALAGLLLAVASRCFAVEVNEKTKAVRECLPGANCGPAKKIKTPKHICLF